jgi:hypothetical protein
MLLHDHAAEPPQFASRFKSRRAGGEDLCHTMLTAGDHREDK